MMEHSLGYVIDHPEAIKSQQSKTHYPMALLMQDVPFEVPPARFLCPDIAPNALDQDGVGACVAFAAETIWQAMEHQDWGKWLFNTASAFKAYDWLKNGTPDGSWPGDGYPGEGSWPEAVWTMAVRYGLPDATGKVHKASAYYAQRLATDYDLIAVQQELMALGPLNIATAWSNAWFNTPVGPQYRVPQPGGYNGAHSYTLVGWETYDGEIWLTFLNSWGAWGSPQGIFRAKASWFMDTALLGPQIVWKVTDIKDAPKPPPPPPLPPLPPLKGDAMRMADTTPRFVTVAAGTQLYRPDAVTPSVKLSVNVTDGYSPFAVDSVSYALRITTGGASQIAVVRKAKCTNVKPYCAAVLAEGETDAALG